MDELVDIFNVYWKNYQDKWSQKYWQIYESLHEKNQEKLDISENYFGQNEEKVVFDHDSIIANNINRDYIHKNNFNSNENGNIFYNINSKENLKLNSTNVQTKTLIHLQDIDDELEKINDESFKKEKKQQEKRRNCFDCVLF